MSKTIFLSGYRLLYEYHPDEPISEGLIRKNAGIGTFRKITDKLFKKRSVK